MQLTVIRQECLVQAQNNWVQPYGIEVQEVLRLAGLSTASAAALLGMSKGGRSIRKWINDETQIPYAAWGVLCDVAGLGLIWRTTLTPDADLDEQEASPFKGGEKSPQINR